MPPMRPRQRLMRTRSVRSVVRVGLMLAAVGLTTGCERLERHAGACESTDACAWGLECSEGHCHRKEDRIARGLGSSMDVLPRRDAFPKQEKRTPEALGELFRAIEGPVTVEFFESSPLPARAVLTSGKAVRPAAARDALRGALDLLAEAHDSLKLGSTRVIPQILADRLGLQVITSQSGEPIIVGAHLRAGEFQEPLGIISDPTDVDYVLGNG